ncbi:EAL domain-containing protein [Alkalicaulis satelles]|uniref:EAL domain-containing protein n=1 Tax=Alkalicaulis satelles TaxID=2609175 RepID=A0A5M6ZQ00_9PROT|nr:EAL domain-containing protein [Alkalicaulis satelles]KAA5805328.1 EAL domain-containing protein [Alkalicaulis satelles]
MSGADFRASADAAGALALAFDGQALSLDGAAGALGLARTAAEGALDALAARLAPGDRPALEALKDKRALDVRLRLVGEDGRLRLIRLIGRPGADGIWRGLILPAGAAPENGLEQLDLEAALREALETGAVIAHYQPIVSLKDRRLAGFEALARWVRADGTVMRADDFLPLALEHGLGGAVGAAVRACAAGDAAGWRAASSSALYVAANATAGELCDPAFAEALIETARGAGLAPGDFRLEITETEVMRDPDAAEQAMRALKAAGIALALDDFGTGYSSLARLDRFPFDTVKIDRYFIRAASADASARAIITSVVRIAHGYAMRVVAEGVETEADAALCADLGCDLGQGFRFARALRPADAAEAVRSGLKGRFGPPA